MRLILPFVTTLLASPVMAQMAVPCGWESHADAIVEPWEDNTATFANGAVRVALLDVAEPAAAAFYFLILHPPLDSLGLRDCTVVGQSEGFGFANIDFSELEVRYDPVRGLMFDVPAIGYLPAQDFQYSTLLTIALDQSTGDVTVTQALGPE